MTVRLLLAAHVAVLLLFALPDSRPAPPFGPALADAWEQGPRAGVPALLARYYVDWFGTDERLYLLYANLMVGEAVDPEEVRARWGALGPELQRTMIPPARPERPLVPYVDFGLEYPPAAIPFLLLPRLVTSDPGFYAAAFRLQMGLVYLAALALVLRRVEDRRRALGVSLLALVALGPVWVHRLDVALSLALVGAAVTRFGGVSLALGAGLKLWPALLLPLVRRQVLPFLIAAGLLFAPAALAGNRLPDLVRFHAERPFQLESTWSSAMLLAGPVETYRSHGARAIRSPLADRLRPLAPLVLLAVFGGVLWRMRREPLPEAFVACALAVLVTGHVLSPQYLTWLFPLALLAPVRTQALLLAACAATQLECPILYSALSDGEPVGIAALVLRNLLLFAALGTLLVRRRAP